MHMKCHELLMTLLSRNHIMIWSTIVDMLTSYISIETTLMQIYGIVAVKGTVFVHMSILKN